MSITVPARDAWSFIQRELEAGHIVVIGPDSMTPAEIKATTAIQLFLGGPSEPEISIMVRKASDRMTIPYQEVPR